MSRSENLEANPAKRTALAQFIRRNVWAVGVVGVVLALAGPSAQASNGDPVLLGYQNYSSGSTDFFSSGVAGLYAESESPDAVYAIWGDTSSGDGVRGLSFSGNGVHGGTHSSQASGVYGDNDGGGFGVAGRSTNGGVAVLADDADGTGTALRTTGKLQFQNRSGIATVASGTKSVRVTLAGVTATSMVTATVQQTGGFFVRAAVPHAGSFTIYLNKAPVSPATVKVAYLVLN